MFKFLSAFSNPYQDESFFEFIVTWLWRLKQLLFLEISVDDLVIDEIQIYTLIAVAVSSAIVGTFLVLRKMTMLANSLSHTILLGIVFAYFISTQFFMENTDGSFLPMGAMLLGALIVGFITTFFTEFLTHSVGIPEDASIGLTFTSLFAVGIILVTALLRNTHIGVEAVMGNADALHKDDLWGVYLIAGINVILCYLCYKEYQVTTFDPAFACALGISPVIFNYLLMTQVSLTTITAFRAVGVLLVLAFITGPVIAARLLSHRIPHILFLSSLFGSFSVLLGVALTRHMMTVYGITLSTSGTVVTVLFVLTLVVILFHKYARRSFLMFRTKILPQR